MEQEKKIDPLKQFYRAPKLYVQLPSRGKFNVLEGEAITGEIAVHAMTSKDELMMKNPDALLNGDAVINSIKSCAPAVKDPMNLPVCDIDQLLIAIRMASYGEFMEAKIKSPHGNKRTDSYDVNLNNILEDVKELPYENTVTLSNGCTVYVRPFSYQLQTKINLAAYDQATALKNVSDIDKQSAKTFKSMFAKLAELNTDSVTESIIKVVTPTGEEVTDPVQIKEFMVNVETADAKAVDKKISALNSTSTDAVQEFVCKETEKKFESEVKLDPSDFFVDS
tara:strand:- start:12086 stop:12925 length:840 start_codon:yes stop_codon:yes gene_type:complete